MTMRRLFSWLNFVFGRLYSWTARRCAHPNHPAFALGALIPNPEVEPAFVAGGVVYYRFKDSFDVPSHRAAAMTQAARELSMGVTKEELEVFLQLCKDFADGKVKTSDFVLRTNVMADKVKWAVEPLALMRLAAATFFDEHESPYYHSEKYAEKKMERWAKLAHENFFLAWPIGKWTLFGDEWKEFFPSYLTAASKKSLAHLKALERVAKDRGMSEHEQKLRYATEMLQTLTSSIGWESTNTTPVWTKSEKETSESKKS